MPPSVAVNQTSRPDGDHARPSPLQCLERVDLLPDRSTTVIIESGCAVKNPGPSKNATRFPSGDTRKDQAARAS